MTISLTLAFKIRLRNATAFKNQNPVLQNKAEMSGKIQEAVKK